MPGHPANFVSTRIRPERLKAGGSRELPSVMQLYEPGVNESEATNVWIALGRFREPPAFTRFGRTSHEAKIARVAGHAPKRLPSRRREQTRLINGPNPFEDEYENENRPAAGLFRGDFLMPETGNQMIVYHSDGLHKGVASSRTEKLETMCF